MNTSNTGAAQEKPATRSWWLALLGLAASGLLAVYVLGNGDDALVEEPSVAELHPLAGSSPRCVVAPHDARARARELEEIADARFERVPFDVREAPEAAVAMAEAEACYRLANDREGRLRVRAKRARIDEELLRRFERAELALALARREGQSEAIAREAHRLSDLTVKAGEPLAAYREWLRQVERAALAELSEAEQAQREER